MPIGYDYCCCCYCCCWRSRGIGRERSWAETTNFLLCAFFFWFPFLFTACAFIRTVWQTMPSTPASCVRTHTMAHVYTYNTLICLISPFFILFASFFFLFCHCCVDFPLECRIIHIRLECEQVFHGPPHPHTHTHTQKIRLFCLFICRFFVWALFATLLAG